MADTELFGIVEDNQSRIRVGVSANWRAIESGTIGIMSLNQETIILSASGFAHAKRGNRGGNPSQFWHFLRSL